MADTIEEFEAELIAAKEAETNLDELTSDSEVSVWGAMYRMVARGLWILAESFKIFKNEIETTTAEKPWGVLRFLQSQALIYQHGDTMYWDGNQFKYAALDPLKQIVKYSVALFVDGQYLVKVALADKVKLNDDQKNGLRAFLIEEYYPGSDIVVISEDPDDLKINLTIEVDPLLISDTGESLSEPGVYPFVEAMNTYNENLPWNGEFQLSKFEDAIQEVTGYVDHNLTSAYAKHQDTGFEEIIRKYSPFAGHLTLDEVNSTITYV